MNFNKYKFRKKIYDIEFSKQPVLLKPCIIKLPKSIGRDRHGQLMYHRGGGVKKNYRILSNILDLYRIIQHQYDPYRSSFISLVQYRSGSLGYVIANSYSFINSVNKLSLLGELSSGSLIYSIQPTPNSSFLLSRSAGSFSKIYKKEFYNVLIDLPSKKQISLSPLCYARVGVPSNIFKKINKLFKAGTTRKLNKRPTVRGVAMNPVDHPHGGGEGKTSSGRSCVSP